MIEVKKGYFKRKKNLLHGYALNGAIYAADAFFFKKSKTFLKRRRPQKKDSRSQK